MDKLIPTWNEKYSIHDTMIDIQHQKLFELAGKVEYLIDKPVYKDEIKNLLAEFFNYMKDHFYEEERYMELIKYPDIETHKKIHKHIIQSMIELIKNIKSANDLKEKLYLAVKKWLLEYILYEDMKVEQYRRSSLASEDDKEVSFEEEGNEELENAVYLYICKCSGAIHDVPFGIHEKIKLQGKKFKCKKCREALEFYKVYSEGF
ncbi:hemerythrin family non-heme iron protein [Campylobacter jejuni]|uniref:hemerythrin domain-containing protein n=1 Tax=Campylobacter jejuni TaxID=197 RepID=UPI0012BDEC40|nr:hemerythrin domain-containing protein [Campylobacter jejuni]EAH4946301.1 hemerythrin family non-heme iron protein [Campylobacter jejuni]EAK7188009.1 hemerythrin family non-heme iron protein [Campylobacter jejuni]EAL8537949.1 hemerythrin family non-heme iron protein [Campylobacter jejuni]EDO8329219.1 hemerythrin family non-heme iron protein [Campylobacter jejuni]EFP6608132.1 hemerythrin family non-heme iron protein [Campylobacter jejuni]